VLGEDRLSPDALVWDHRNMHHFLGPCCLCPLMRPINEEPHYREAAIYMPVMGRYKGEYIAECARNLCGFIGWSLFSLNKDFSYTTAQFPWRGTTTSSMESPWDSASFRSAAWIQGSRWFLNFGKKSCARSMKGVGVELELKPLILTAGSSLFFCRKVEIWTGKCCDIPIV